MRLIRALAIVALIVAICVLIDRQLAGAVKPNATTLVLALIVVLLVLGLAFPQRFEVFFARLSTFKLGGLEVGLGQVEHSAVVNQLVAADEDGVRVSDLVSTGTTAGDLDQVRLRLLDRLAWLAHELELSTTAPAEILADLEAQKVVDPAQRRFAVDLLAASRPDLASVPLDFQKEYVERAWRFVNRLRATVFDQAVRRDMRELGWFVADFEQRRGHRPDFLVAVQTRWVLVAPRVALDPDSGTNERTGQISMVRRRWSRASDLPIPLARRLIVIPRETSAATSADDLCIVLKRSELPSLPGVLHA